MGRGFFAGISWGALVGVVTLALASQLTERRELAPATPQRAEVEIPGGSEFNQARPETEPVLPEPDARPAASEPVAVAAPESAAVPPSLPETASPAAPEAVASAPEPTEEPDVPETAGVSGPAEDAGSARAAAPSLAEAPATDAAVVSLPQPSSVSAPVVIAQPTAPETGPAGLPAPATSDTARPTASAPRPALEAPSAPPAAIVSAVTPPAAPEVEDKRIALSGSVDGLPQDVAGLAPAAPVADALPQTGPEAPEAPEVEAEVMPAPDAPVVETEVAQAPAAPVVEPEVAQAPEAPAVEAEVAQAPEAPDTPSEGALASPGPTPGFAGAAGVRVNRLPTVGAEGPAADAVEAEVEVPAAEALPDADAPAIVRNAVPFENPDLAPMIVIVLLHDAPVAPAAETGRDLPVPVSFAVDAGLVEAGSIADAYRAAGREILLVPTLPPGAAATDVEVALQVNFDVIPEAVAIMDLPEGGFQSEREAVAQVVAAISTTGHGLVTFPRGLNMAQQMADRAGVPARPVFRMLEGGDTNAALRTLDQASFRARQEGAVILVGTAEPATVEAIRRWSEANAGGDVVFGPVSAALSSGE